MLHLQGLREYLNEVYEQSIFDQALNSGQSWEFHLHGHQIVRARVLENQIYDLKMDLEGRGITLFPKTDIKLLYPAKLAESIRPLIKIDKKVKSLGLEPIVIRSQRHHIKNKTLFPLMKEKEVVFFTLLEGEVIRGLIAGFSRYEITVNLKGGKPITLLRHSIYDVRNKKGRCFLKSFQEKHKDWQKSPLFVA